MFERFTEDGRHAVVLAQEEARQLRHDHIGTEHLLLGLLRVPNEIPVRTLAAFNVDAAAARAKVAERPGSGDERPSSSQIPFTSDAKKALELSLRAALNLGHDWIGSAHVLLGLLDVGPSPGSDVLASLGVPSRSLRDQVVAAIESSDRAKNRIAMGHSAASAGTSAGLSVASETLNVGLRPEVEEDLAFLDGGDSEFGDFGPRSARGHVRPPSFDDAGLLVVVGGNGEVAGSVSWRWNHWGPNPGSRCPMIGIWLRPQARGRGIGRTAQRQLVELFFRHTTVNRVEAHTDVDNVAEQRALEGAGFQREGITRGAQWRDGAHRDGFLYSILRSDLYG